MAQPTRIVVSAVGLTPVLMDWMQNPFNAIVGVDVSNAVGAAYTVQYTLSDYTGMLELAGAVLSPNAGETPLWRADTTLGTSQSTSGVATYTAPVFGVRLNLTAITSGFVVLEVLQGMSTPA